MTKQVGSLGLLTGLHRNRRVATLSGMTRRGPLLLLFAVATTGLVALESGFLGPGTVATRSGWTLSVRAERDGGAAVGAQPGEPSPSFALTGPVTSSLWDYPVVVLKGPSGRIWEYSTLTEEGETSALAWLRLEPDWDGDGRPEVAGRFHHGYRVGQGILPSGIVSVVDRLLLPGPTRWKAEVELGTLVGDEGGGEIRGLSVVLVAGKAPRPTEWSWSETKGSDPRTKTVTFSVASLLWKEGALTDIKRSTVLMNLTSLETGEVADPGWPRVTLNDQRVNLRLGTGVSYPSLGLLSQGTVLLVRGMDSEPGVSGNLRSPWLKVEPTSGPLAGKIGWVFAHYCSPAF